MSNAHDDDRVVEELDADLRRAVAGIRIVEPRNVETRLPRLVELAQKTPASPSETVTPKKLTVGRCHDTSRTAQLRWLGGILACAAAAAVVILALSRPSTGFAEIANAVRDQTWVRAILQETDAGQHEFWVSLVRDVSAQRLGKWALFDDHRVGVRYEYDQDRNLLLRSAHENVGEIGALQRVFRALFSGDDYLGSRFGNDEIVLQERRTRVDGNRKWDDYALTLRRANSRVDLVLRVDPESHLPYSMRLQHHGRGQDRESVYLFDYPNEGPVDIYALGVPRSAKLDDRVPPAELGRILEVVKESRNKFDAYRAYVVMSDGSNDPSASPNLDLVWSKEGRWRVDVGTPLPTWRPEQPPSGTDMLSWWKQRSEHFRFTPVMICDGKRLYRNRIADPNEAGEHQRSWEVVSSFQPEQAKATAAAFGGWQYMPDLHAYPVSVGLPSRHLAVQLHDRSDGGPIGSVLVSYDATTDLPDPRSYKTQRYWLDPQHGYMTVQYQLGGCPIGEHGPLNESPPRDTYVMEQPVRSLRGFWYPTVVRRRDVRVRKSDGKSVDQVTHFYVDFRAEIPDSLFQP